MRTILINIEKMRVIYDSPAMTRTVSLYRVEGSLTYHTVHAAPISMETMSHSWSNEGLSWGTMEIDEKDSWEKILRRMEAIAAAHDTKEVLS
jgi:hypothetical protein